MRLAQRNRTVPFLRLRCANRSYAGFHLFGGRLKTGQAGEYWVAGGVAALCLAIALLGRAAEGGFSPYFVDYAGLYRRGMIDAKEWRENRFRWF